MYCNCPYKRNCKHMVALFYYLENCPKVKDSINYLEIITSYTKKDLIDFLLEELPKNRELAYKLLLFKENNDDLKNIEYDEKYYACKLEGNLFNSEEILKFMDEDIQELITHKQFDLMFKLMTIIIDHINQELEYGDFPLLADVIYKIDSIITQIHDTASIDDITNFLIHGIENTSDYFVDDQLTDCLSRNGDIEYYLNDFV